jgi:branched-chain amino acid transport system permease protein
MQVIVNILYSFTLILGVGLSFYIIYNVVNFFHIAHAALITSGAYLTQLFSQQFKFNLAIAIILAIIVTILFGLIIEYCLYRNLRKRTASSLSFLISSLGLYVIIQNIVSIIWGDQIKSIRTFNVTVGNEIAGAYISNIQILTIVISIFLFLCIFCMFKYSSIGKKMRAISENKELSSILGINSSKMYLLVFGLGSGIAAIMGILGAFDTDMTPTMGFNLFLYGVVAMIIGGVGSIWGLAGGALLLASAQHLGAYYIDSKWMDAIAYLILILFLIWKPLGFSGKRLKKIEI